MSAPEFANYETFAALDIRVGTIVDVQEFPNARQPAYKIWVDFGPLGIKQSSAQITELYTPDNLLDTQVIAVVNFPPKQIATFQSEILILGIYSEDGVVLLRPELPVKDGQKIG